MGSLVPLELKIVGLASQQSVITSGAEDKEKPRFSVRVKAMARPQTLVKWSSY